MADSEDHRLKFPFAHPNLQICLLNKPHIVRFELRDRVRQLEVEFTDQMWDQLAHFYHGNIFAQTSSCTMAELEEAWC